MESEYLDHEVLLAVFEQAPDLIALTEFETGRIVYLNPAGIDLVGLDAADAEGLIASVLFTDAGLAQTQQIEESLHRHGRWQGVSELRHFRTRQPIPVSISTFVLRDIGSSPPTVIASIVRDQRRRRQHKSTLRHTLEASASRAREQQALAELSQLAFDTDLAALLTAAARAASTLLGMQCASVSSLTGPGDALEVLAYCGQAPQPATFPVGSESQPGYALATGTAVVCTNRAEETRFSTTAMASRGLRSGVVVPIGVDSAWGVLTVHSAHPRDYTGDEVAFLHAVAGIVSAAARRIDVETRLRHLSTHDPLTGLPNRAEAFRRITAALDTARRENTTMALLLADFDDFKIVNDSLGHAHGDAVLVRLAEQLTSAVRPTDTVARVGGDEFVIICDNVGTEGAISLADRISAVLRSPLPQSADPPVPFSASIGIAVSDATCTAEDLIRRSDLAMYRAKHAGAGNYALYHQDDVGDSDDADRILRLAMDLRTALSEDGLTLVYQPIFDLARGTVVAVEALARWAHPTLGEIGPTEFIAVAERTGLIGSLGRWALRTACEQAVVWQQRGVDVRVNVSIVQLHDPSFAGIVADILDSTGLPAHRLGLEITAASSAAVTSRTVTTLTALHALGVVLLLDDLGTGSSPFAQLNRYPMFDYVKIDRFHVHALPGRRPEAIVNAIVDLTHAFDGIVVGEGVETQNQLDILRASGCDLAQGFFLAKPVTADEILALLRQHPDDSGHAVYAHVVE